MHWARCLSRRTEKGKHYGAVTAKALAVLEALLWAFHNGKSGLCFPSYERIADAAGCARSSIAGALHALEDAGILSWVHRLKRVRVRCPDLFGADGNRLTVGVMALVAEQEREAISQRTKAALAAAKARGTRLGKPKGTKVPNAEIGCARSVETNMANAESFAQRMRPVLTELNELSARSAAQELERRGYATARGGKWSATLVIRTRARLGAAS